MDLQAQARAHRIGQKRDVLVLRMETVLIMLTALCLVFWLAKDPTRGGICAKVFAVPMK